MIPDAFAGLRDRATSVFAASLARLAIHRVLDLGSAPASFGVALREKGFDGVLFSAVTLSDEAEARARLSGNLGGPSGRERPWLHDPRWVVLRRGKPSNPPNAAPSSDGAFDSALATELGGARVKLTSMTSGVLEPLLRDHPGLAVLQLELEDDPTGSVRLDPWALDAWLVRKLGFERAHVELSSAAAEPKTLRFAAVYHRDAPTLARPPFASESAAPSPRGAANPEITQVDVFTSLGGPIVRMTRDGIDLGARWQHLCLTSFLQTGARVISVSEVAPPLAEIAWHQTPAKPKLVEVLAAIESTTTGHAILVNGDISLTPALKAQLPRLDPAVFYYGNRTEVEADASDPPQFLPTSPYEYGFDYFFMPPNFIRAVNRLGEFPDSFRVGEPWWDYVLPLLALSLGYPTKRLGADPPLALHCSHKARYSATNWIEHGVRFVEFLNAVEATSPTRLGSLLREIAARFNETMTPIDRINAVARAVVTFLP